MFNTPVALFVFNRPEITQRTFDALRQVRPSRLAIVADGPRCTAEVPLCDQVRRIVTKVDWPCELHLLFSETNLGCRARVASGLDWVFGLFDRAVILEDDCVPSEDFFPFCATLLERYANDARVKMIGGSAPHGGIPRSHSYFFSRYTLIWGWATWRRAWVGYDVDMASWPGARDSGFLEQRFDDERERQQWRERFDRTHSGHTTWDHQWTFHCWRHDGLAALPTVNLVTNIGIGPAATHTKSISTAARLSVPFGKLEFPLVHPEALIRDHHADGLIYRSILGS